MQNSDPFPPIDHPPPAVKKRALSSTSLPSFEPIDPIIFGLRKAAYSPAEVMELIGISRAPFYRLVKDGEIPIARHGTRTLVLAIDLARLLLKMRNEGLPSRPKREGERPRCSTPKTAGEALGP